MNKSMSSFTRTRSAFVQGRERRAQSTRSRCMDKEWMWGRVKAALLSNMHAHGAAGRRYVYL